MVVRVGGRIQLPANPSDALGELYGGFDLILGMAGGLVDEDRSQGRASSELECAAAHRGVVGEPTKKT